MQLREFETVSKLDPFGRGYKHRACRILFNVDGHLRKVCWVVMELDGSVSFGLSNKEFVVIETASSYLHANGHFVTEHRTNLDGVAMSDRKSAHVTLHSSGVCHMRANRAKPLFEYSLEGWYPVKTQLRWIFVFTDPVMGLPEVRTAHSRDAIVRFPDATQSARIEVDLLPQPEKPIYPLIPSAPLQTICGIGAGYVVRLSVFTNPPKPACLFVVRP